VVSEHLKLKPSTLHLKHSSAVRRSPNSKGPGAGMGRSLSASAALKWHYRLMPACCIQHRGAPRVSCTGTQVVR
jgi:hypothetical protein